jgi:hypothetical protein
MLMFIIFAKALWTLALFMAVTQERKKKQR